MFVSWHKNDKIYKRKFLQFSLQDHLKLTVLEFYNNLWGLGTDLEWSCGIDSWALKSIKNTGTDLKTLA
jgi:hypothetical protein